MSKGQLTLFDCLSLTSPTSPKRPKIQETHTTDPELQELESDSGTESELLSDSEDDSKTEETSEVGDNFRGLPCNRQQCQDITVNKPLGPTTIVLNTSVASHGSRARSEPGAGEAQHQQAPSDIAAGPLEAPKRPRVKFPSRSFGTGRQRAFNPEWYKSHSWLEYSVERDAAFCYPCRVFKCGSSRSEDAFTRTGFRNWKHAIGKSGIISLHAKCATHRQAVTCWNEYTINTQGHTTVVHRLDSARKQLIETNRHYIRTVAEVLLLCAKQDLALRGHREYTELKNQGNFKEILTLVASHDPVVKEKLQDGPRNAVYTSPEIQNTLLEIMGNAVRDRICKAVRESGVFSLLADETKDASKVEQLAIVLRYVDINTASVYERFLTYVPAESLTAQGLSRYILQTLQKYQLDPECIVSQGYDGASVMSGSCSGVQTQIREVAPHAFYVHCNAHCLNLCLVDSVKAIHDASEFFGLLETLYVFLSSTKCHVIFIEQQTRLHPDKQHRQLQKLSDTRWACRQSAVNAVCYTYDAVLATLLEAASKFDGSRAAEARGLLLQVKSFRFILCLIIFDRLLSCAKGLSDVLQSTKLDLAKAADLISGTIETIEVFRSGDEWEKVFAYCENVAQMHNIPTIECTRSRRPPKRFDDGVVLETTGVRDRGSTSDNYKISLYYPVLDSFLSELKRRFTNKNKAIMQALQTCCPTSCHFFDINHLQPLITTYNLDLEALRSETQVAKRTLAGKELEDISDVIMELAPLKLAFPTLVKLLQISMTIC